MIDLNKVRESLIDLSDYRIEYRENKFIAKDDRLFQKIIECITQQSGYSFCYGINKVLRKHNLSIFCDKTAESIRIFFEEIFLGVTSGIDVQKFNVTDNPYNHIGKMDVDGFNINKSHSPNAHTESREFATVKCLHFDGATPFIANIYGPNVNIGGGFPVIGDVPSYCNNYNVSPRTLVENIPENYNVVIKKEHYNHILNDYSIGLEFDMENDMIMSVLFNEVTGGVAHGATTPYKKDPKKPALRPIRHLEFQYANPENYKKWYDYYHLKLDKAGNVEDEGSKLILNYHSQETKPFGPIIKIDN